MVLLKMLMEIALPKMGELLVMMTTMISPFREGSSLGGIAPLEGKSSPAQVSPRDGGAPSRKSSSYFFYVKMSYIPEDGHRRWAEEGTTHQGAPRWVVPTWWAPSGGYLLQ